MDDNEFCKKSLVKRNARKEFKSDVRGNDLTAGTLQSAPTGMSVKQTSFTVTKTDVCHDYSLNPKKYTFLSQ